MSKPIYKEHREVGEDTARIPLTGKSSNYMYMFLQSGTSLIAEWLERPTSKPERLQHMPQLCLCQDQHRNMMMVHNAHVLCHNAHVLCHNAHVL